MQTINLKKQKQTNKQKNFVIQISFLFDHLDYFSILRLDQPVVEFVNVQRPYHDILQLFPCVSIINFRKKAVLRSVFFLLLIVQDTHPHVQL